MVVEDSIYLIYIFKLTSHEIFLIVLHMVSDKNSQIFEEGLVRLNIIKQ